MHHGVKEYLRILADNTAMDKLYLALFLRRIAYSLTALFIPLFLYNNGFPIWSIFAFYSLEQAYYVLAMYPVAKAMAKTSVVKSFIAAFPLGFAYFYFLPSTTASTVAFILVPALNAASMILSNIATHTIFMDDVDDQKEGKEVSLFSSVGLVATLLSPALAGYVASVDFASLFLLAGFFLLSAAIPLLTTSLSRDVSADDLWERMKPYLNFDNQTRSFAGYALSKTLDRVLWPIFLIVAFASIIEFGFIQTSAALISLVVTYATGLRSDDGDNNTVLTYSNEFYTFTYVARLLSFTPVVAGLLEAVRRISYRALYVSWNTAMVRYAEGTDTYAFIVSREMIYKMSRVVFLPFFALAFYAGMPIRIGLLFGGAMTWFYADFINQNKGFSTD